MVVVLYITKVVNTKPLHGIQTGSPLVVTLGQQYNVGEKPTAIRGTGKPPHSTLGHGTTPYKKGVVGLWPRG